MNPEPKEYKRIKVNTAYGLAIQIIDALSNKSLIPFGFIKEAKSEALKVIKKDIRFKNKIFLEKKLNSIRSNKLGIRKDIANRTKEFYSDIERLVNKKYNNGIT